jgi:hypothetical protein
LHRRGHRGRRVLGADHEIVDAKMMGVKKDDRYLVAQDDRY